MSEHIGTINCGAGSNTNHLTITQCNGGMQLTLGDGYGLFNQRKIEKLILLLIKLIKTNIHRSGCDTEEHF